MLKGRYKIVFNYVRKQINKGNYSTGYDYRGEKTIYFERVIISSLYSIFDPVWYVLPKNKDKHTGYNLIYHCDTSLKYYLRELLEKELKNEQI